jgi:hypothetical protein
MSWQIKCEQCEEYGTDKCTVAQKHSIHITEEHAPTVKHVHTFAKQKTIAAEGTFPHYIACFLKRLQFATFRHKSRRSANMECTREPGAGRGRNLGICLGLLNFCNTRKEEYLVNINNRIINNCCDSLG